MPSDDLEPRVSGLEDQVHKLTDRVRASEHDAAAARILAGAADRDVEEFRVELHDLRGELHEVRDDLRGELHEVRDDLRGEVQELRGELHDFRRATTGSFNALRADFTKLRSDVDDGFIEMRGKFDATAAGQQHIVKLLEGIIAGQS
ncbi:MAG TPA: hypothetical protein VFR17_01115 [Mycobacterium sp.]|nr:hypothetical protein [Mycobacterium sp.]